LIIQLFFATKGRGPCPGTIKLTQYLAGICLVSASLLGSAASLLADDTPSVTLVTLDAEWQTPVTQFAAFLADLSADRMDDAWQKFQKMTPRPQAAAATPFDADPFQAFKKSLGRFPPEIENLTVIAERRWTTNARKFHLMCDTQAGPVLIDVQIYRSQGHWYFGTLTYHALLAGNKDVQQQAEKLVPTLQYAQPFSVPLTKTSSTQEMTAR